MSLRWMLLGPAVAGLLGLIEARAHAEPAESSVVIKEVALRPPLPGQRYRVYLDGQGFLRGQVGFIDSLTGSLQPSPNALVRFAQGGRLVADARADEAGRFALPLPPGTYAVTALGAGGHAMFSVFISAHDPLAEYPSTELEIALVPAAHVAVQLPVTNPAASVSSIHSVRGGSTAPGESSQTGGAGLLGLASLAGIAGAATAAGDDDQVLAAPASPFLPGP